MVLVDSTHPDQFEGSQPILILNRAAGLLGPLLAVTGIPRVFSLYPSNRDPARAGEAVTRALYYTSPHQVAMFEEMGAIPAMLEEARGTGRLGDKPLMVVSAADHDAKTGVLQEELTALSSNSIQRGVEGSTHVSLVVGRGRAGQTSEEILKVVEAVRTGQPLVAR